MQLLSPSHFVDQRPKEGGYMLMGVALFLVLVTFMLGTLSFVTKRNARFQANYAVGEHIAHLANMAHNFAQSQRYTLVSPMELDGVLLYSSAATAAFTPPDGFGFSPLSGTNFIVEVRGSNEAPLAPSLFQAASAYMHVRIRPDADIQRSSTDDIALMQGANHRGMSRVGRVQGPNGDLCDGGQTRVRWGEEASSCLNDTHIGTLGFSDVREGDIIVPAWETALARSEDRAVYRYPQPERPDMNRMATALNMQANPILNAATTSTENINAGGNVALQDMTVRHNQATGFQDTVTVNNQPMRVYDQNGVLDPVMNVTGLVEFTAANLSVGDTLQVGTGTLDVVVANPVYTNELGNVSHALAIDVRDAANVEVVVQDINPASTINNLVLLNDASRLAVTGNLDTTQFSPGNGLIGGVPSANLYGAELLTATGGNTQIVHGSGNVPWEIGAIDQKNTGSLGVSSLQIETCLGKACPDNVTDTPDGGL